MAAAIKYFDTAKMAHCRITTGVTASDGSGSPTALTWYNTAPATDWMLTKVTVHATSATGVGDLADSLINFFVSDGSTIRCFRTIDPGNPAAGSTTVSEYSIEILFGPEFIFPSTVLPQVSVTVTPTAGNLDFVVWAQAS